MPNLEIPQKSIYRISLYARCLERLDENGHEMVSSSALAAAAGVKPSQLRRDLAYFGTFGTRGRGYPVEALRQAGAEVQGMVAIFPYGFPLAEDNFRQAKVSLHTLTDYHTLLESALQSGDILPDQVSLLQEWRKNPSQWKAQPKDKIT